MFEMLFFFLVRALEQEFASCLSFTERGSKSETIRNDQKCQTLSKGSTQ